VHIAVLGGGQLGRMLGLAGIPLGCTFSFLDPADGAPATEVGALTVGALDDIEAARAVAQGSAVVTYEWEGVPAATARALESVAPVRPGPRALDVSQDRLIEKNTLRSLGVGTAPFRAVDSLEDLEHAVTALGLPAVLKTRRGGYDGKGQAVIREEADVDQAWRLLGDVPLILEAFIPFVRELSILAVRGVGGEMRAWPVVENEHRDGILRKTHAPARFADQGAAEACIKPLFEELEFVGVGCVELFETQEGLLANEIAPRVHNSGHWTIEGAETSQFENHVRAVADMPLGGTDIVMPSVMLNCIGTMPDRDAVMSVAGAHFHDYGKSPRPGRKLGHITVTAPDEHTLADRVAQVETLIPE
jgi:5-(carboxyamino)imidazole ribonucleotide synthase